jgi:hypothetical protein
MKEDVKLYRILGHWVISCIVSPGEVNSTIVKEESAGDLRRRMSLRGPKTLAHAGSTHWSHPLVAPGAMEPRSHAATHRLDMDTGVVAYERGHQT